MINAKKQRKTIEWETRDLFKKIRDTKGTFHAKMGSIKDRNGTDLTKAEDIKKRWQEYTESKSEVSQSCPTLCDPMDCSLPGSSVHGIFQQEYWSGLPFPSPGDLPEPGTESRSPALQADALLSELPGKP